MTYIILLMEHPLERGLASALLYQLSLCEDWRREFHRHASREHPRNRSQKLQGFGDRGRSGAVLGDPVRRTGQRGGDDRRSVSHPDIKPPPNV
jgi:hypothetical protein